MHTMAFIISRNSQDVTPNLILVPFFPTRPPIVRIMRRSDLVLATICLYGVLIANISASRFGHVPTPTSVATLDATASESTSSSMRRCQPNESCADITAGPEVPIAVTTIMM